MERKQLNLLPCTSIRLGAFVIVFVICCGFGDSSTRDDQVEKLMAFKKSSVEADPRGFLSNWNPDSWSPCSWNGVFCSNDGNVIELDVKNGGLIGRLYISHIMALPNLTALHFSGNFFYGNLSTTTTTETCNFEILDLSANNFSEFDYSLHSCDRLVFLNLSHNSIQGGNLEFGPSLQVLDLSNNNISGDIDFASCRNLRKLNLSFNRLEATQFPASLANCKNLEELDLGNNDLVLEIPGDLLRKLRKLRKLVLASNKFYGEIPPQLGNLCGTLEELDLSNNQLTGGLPSSFAFCSSLLSINLGHNLLSVNFLSTVIGSITNLLSLQLQFNNINGSIPQSLTNFTQLQVLDISANALTGNLPSDFCSKKFPSALVKIKLADNYLTGAIPRGLGFCRNLRVINLSLNILSGPIPSEIWTLPNLSDIVMWANNITGEIPRGICNKGANIKTLILNNNLITGKIPISIANCTNLVWLSLFSNRLVGDIPWGIGDLANLSVLQLGDNSLTGVIPTELGRSRSLVCIELSDNFLTGNIPSELANQTGLLVPGIAPSRTFVFVKNKISRGCIGSGRLIELEGIKRIGKVYDLLPFRNCTFSKIHPGNVFYPSERNGSMIHIDLSNNYLSGSIPERIGTMYNLRILNLGHNRLTGNIPYNLGGLKSLSTLDLSYNKLGGSIPGSLQMLSFLSDIDVSNNILVGPIPSGGQLITFPASRFENNSGLCGIPLPRCGSDTNQGQSPPMFEHSSAFLRGFRLHFLIGFLPFFVSSFCIFTLCFDLKFGQLKGCRYKVHRRNRR